jgi:hypothetical protein
MESNNLNKSNYSNLGGYGVNNLLNGDAFFAKENKKPKPSFKIMDISIIENSEILKLSLGSGYLCRIMKTIDNISNQPATTFDLVNLEKKSIEFKANKLFINSIGLGGNLFQNNQLTQWEAGIVDLIGRAFLYGDKELFLNLINENNIKVSKDADWFIKNEMD